MHFLTSFITKIFSDGFQLNLVPDRENDQSPRLVLRIKMREALPALIYPSSWHYIFLALISAICCSWSSTAATSTSVFHCSYVWILRSAVEFQTASHSSGAFRQTYTPHVISRKIYFPPFQTPLLAIFSSGTSFLFALPHFVFMHKRRLFVHS
jgi:hypothetical protein